MIPDRIIAVLIGLIVFWLIRVYFGERDRRRRNNLRHITEAREWWGKR